VRLFVGYYAKPNPQSAAAGIINDADEPQFQGVVFDDGTVAVRWLTTFRSHSTWANYRSFFRVHVAQQGTRIEWVPSQDGKVVMVERHDTIVMEQPDLMDMVDGEDF
jgi:hypothetical protein